MDDQVNAEPSIKSNVYELQCRNGMLKVYTKHIRGVKVLEAFTLESLAECMGMSMTTMEGRYQRGKLKYLTVGIATGRGRPVRGFPLALINDVVAILTTPGAAVKRTADGEYAQVDAKPAGPLIATHHDGKVYYTVDALAEHFAVSMTTVRNKLARSGLSKKLVSLGSSPMGGRARRALPESQLGNAKLAIVHGETFLTELDHLLLRGIGQLEKDTMKSQALAQVIPFAPVNAVNPNAQRAARRADDVDTEALVGDLMAEINAIKWNDDGAVAPAEPAPDHAAGDSAADVLEWATMPGEHAVAALDATWNALAVGSDEEPTDGEYADWREIMRAAGVVLGDADAMVAKVKLHWGQA